MSATLCSRSGAMRAKFSLAKSHDGKMCTTYAAYSEQMKLALLTHCINFSTEYHSFKQLPVFTVCMYNTVTVSYCAEHNKMKCKDIEINS
jgi:hypothetical protein